MPGRKVRERERDSTYCVELESQPSYSGTRAWIAGGMEAGWTGSTTTAWVTGLGWLHDSCRAAGWSGLNRGKG
jgi:hypothetical protein